MTRSRTAVPLLLVLLTATACTGGAEKAAPAKPPRLKEAWSIPSPQKPAASAHEKIWLAHGVLAMRTGSQGDQLTGYAAGSGEQRWQLPLPKGTTGVCALSERVNGKGVGGVLLDAGDGDERCSVAAAVDVRRGKVLWKEPLGRGDVPTGDEVPVSVGEKTLTASARWNDVARFRLEGGGDGGKRKLPDLPHFSGGGSNSGPVHHDGRYVAVQNKSGFAVYDADKGTRLWHRPAKGRGTHLEGLLSGDPVVLDALEKGHRFPRAYGPLGGEGEESLLGRELNRTNREAPLTARGTLVTTYEKDNRVFAYDMRTGKRAWARKLAPSESLVGIRGGTVLTLRQFSAEKWLLSRDLRGGAPRTLGRVTGQASGITPLAWDAHRLYVRGTDRSGAELLRAYELPARGSARSYKAPAHTVDASVASEAEAACAAVKPDSLRAMKLSGDRPPPESCTWKEEYEPEGVTRELAVEVKDHGSRSRAKRELAYPEGLARGVDLSQARGARGLGGGAKVLTRGKSREDNTSWALARHGRFTVVVKAATEARDPDTRAPDPDVARADSPSPEQTERAARGAAEDVLRSLKDRTS
ncbi:PQQ-binding-like beta-propeller repeat protein [Streptomyces sp. NPDC048172]|uniref:outer membrane protein assembly factor BamB family protein n=1 Tax=Streptomyces sp. NPDC048172 TaxID=3365505 RepID=UPI0037145E5A